MSVKNCTISNCFECYWSTNYCESCNQYSLIVGDKLCFNCYNNKHKSVCKSCLQLKNILSDDVCFNCTIMDYCLNCKKSPSSLEGLCYDCLINNNYFVSNE